MTHPPMPTSHAMIAVDIEKYSGRNDQQQLHLQEALVRVLDAAAAEAGLDRSTWTERQPQGDGEFSWLPPHAHLGVLVGGFVRELDGQLGLYNRRRAGRFWTRMRLRMAVHFGPVHLGAPNGVAGRHAVQQARLLDSAPVRRALDTCPAADLALIVSDRVYDDYISQGLGEPHAYRPVQVRVKEHSCIAYLHVPGHDIGELGALDLFDPEEPATPDKGRAAANLDRDGEGRRASTIVYGDQIGGPSHRADGHGVVNAPGRDQVIGRWREGH
ncbi:hypothetical protein [Microbispora siamensis]|uniref:Uncharacterized protein n=1 Tax=Microbispora siamensis TaxID=564413 RepID=A0ABQ4GHC7_9ACTN|nr:hypothetical protein [Microbispora siamensis]GIH60825.1 hypothetical protein Msi02_16420 [Microbispora siamensis]